MRFLDTNVILRYLTRDDESKADACYRLFQRVKQGEEELFTCEAIVAEVTYVLSSPRAPYHSVTVKSETGFCLSSPCEVSSFQKRACLRALDLYASSPVLDFEDALAVAHMEQRGVAEIVSYDKDFDRLTGIRRTEPEQLLVRRCR